MSRFTRRDFLKRTTAGAATLAGGGRLAAGAFQAGHGADESSSRPNVLTILVDQLRYDAFSHRGNAVIATPNLDRLAAAGTVFTDAVCSSPVCGPSRASLLSGCYAFDGTYAFGNREPEAPAPWRREITTVDEALAGANYHVEYHGKWHCGRDHRECYRGDTRVFGHNLTDYHAYLAERYQKPDVSAEHKVDRYTKWPYRFWPIDEMMATAPAKGYLMPHHNEAGIIDVSDDDTMTAWTAQKTLRFLRGRPTSPFAVTCSILQPHAPLIASERYARLFDPADIPLPANVNHTFERNPPIPDAIPADATGLGEFASLYYGLVKEVDDWVGRLLTALDETGMADNTLVVFTADHGELMGSHRTVSKSKFYEESLRVPLIMRYPKEIPAGRESRAPASGADIAPTILDYCGVAPLEQFRGRSLRQAVDEKPSGDSYAYSELGARRCLRSVDWKYVTGPAGPQLFDLRNDPHEMRNLAAEEPNSRRVKRIAAEHAERLATDYPVTPPAAPASPRRRRAAPQGT